MKRSISSVVARALFIAFLLPTVLYAQAGAPLIVESLGPAIVSPNRPKNVPAGLTVREQRFLLSNISAKDIVVYTIVFSHSPGRDDNCKKYYSYPPGPPALPAGQSQKITHQFIETGGQKTANARVDLALFADGSTYGPDKFKTREIYTAILDTQRLTWLSVLEMLESDGSEKTKAFLRQKLNERDYLKRRQPPNQE